MAAPLLKFSIGNSASTSSTGSILGTDTSVPLSSDTNFQAAPTPGEGVILMDEGTTSEELAYSTGVSSGSLTIPLANRGLEGTAASDHSGTFTVKGPFTAGMWNGVITAMLNAFVQSTGALDTTKVTDLHTAQTLTNKVMDYNSNTFQNFPAASIDGWTALAATLTYSSVDGHTFIVSTSIDVSGSIGVGDRIKFTNNSTTFYGIVTAINATTMTLYGGTQYSVANLVITNPYYSHQKSPYGFNTRIDYWTERISNNTSYQQNPPVTGTWYDASSGVLALAIPIGVWKVKYSALIYANETTGTGIDVASTFSTTTNSESDTDFHAEIALSGASGSPFNAATPITREKIIALASKTTYTLLIKAVTAANQIFINPGPSTPTIIEAICAYL